MCFLSAKMGTIKIALSPHQTRAITVGACISGFPVISGSSHPSTTQTQHCHYVFSSAKGPEAANPAGRFPCRAASAQSRASDAINPIQGPRLHNRVICLPSQGSRPSQLFGAAIWQRRMEGRAAKRSVYCRGSEAIDGGEMPAPLRRGIACMDVFDADLARPPMQAEKDQLLMRMPPRAQRRSRGGKR